MPKRNASSNSEQAARPQTHSRHLRRTHRCERSRQSSTLTDRQSPGGRIDCQISFIEHSALLFPPGQKYCESGVCPPCQMPLWRKRISVLYRKKKKHQETDHHTTQQ